jgi:predicted type IV restriction endonuclease
MTDAELPSPLPPPPPVVEHVEAPVLADPPPPASPKGPPRWEVDAREKVRAAIRKFSKPLADLIARDANEGDTRLLVTDFLCEGLGYDKYEDLTTEYQVKGEFADYGVRIDKQLVAFIEVKRCTTKLGPKHLRQVEMYAVNEGVEWIVLTNGAVWQVYHITGGLPVVVDLAFDVDLVGEGSLGQKANEMFFLTRAALKRRALDDLWKAKAATSPKSLGKVLGSQPVLDAIRKELRRSTGQTVDTKDLHKLILQTVLRPECFDPRPGTAPL